MERPGAAALCHYIGHWRCIRFQRNLPCQQKSKQRQALIEFRFAKFDNSLANKIACIASD